MVVEQPLTPWILFAVTLTLLRLTQRWLERHLLGLGLLITGQTDSAVMVYYVVMFPGVFIHEVSHWLMAGILGVRTTRLVIWPERTETGRLRLGYLETETVEAWRNTLIGVAPIVSGLGLVLLLSHHMLNLPAFAAALAAADMAVIIPAVEDFIRTPDFWIWLYLMFTISNNMMPSGPDRRGWSAVIVAVILLSLTVTFLGLGETIWAMLGGPLTEVMGTLAAIFTPIIGLNIFAIGLVWLLEQTLGRLTGQQVEYRAVDIESHAATPTPAPQEIQTLLDIPLPVPAPDKNAPVVELDPTQLYMDFDDLPEAPDEYV